MLSMLAAMVTGWPDGTLATAAQTLVAGVGVAGLLALAFANRRRRALPLTIVLLVAVLVMPLFNANSTYLNGTRYLNAFLPLCYVLLADAALRAWHSAGGTRPAILTRSALTGAGIVLAASPLAWLTLHYHREDGAGRTNATLLALSRGAASQTVAPPLVVDPLLEWRKVEGGGRLDLVVDYLLTMENVPHETLPTHEIAHHVARAAWPSMILLRETRDHLGGQCYPRQAEQFGLEPLHRAWLDKFDDERWSVGLFAPATVPMTNAERSIFGGPAELLGYTWTPRAVAPREPAYLTLYRRPGRTTERPLSVFVHLLNPGGTAVAQADGPPETWRFSGTTD